MAKKKVEKKIVKKVAPKVEAPKSNTVISKSINIEKGERKIKG